MTKQKQIFLESEGDAWYRRNREALASRSIGADDPIIAELLGIPLDESRLTKILEIGCGGGERLAWIADTIGADAYGIEPSAEAVEVACSRGVKAQQGTADRLPYDDESFDMVVFGFCLYLCDAADLFSIAAEAHRVLKSESWLLLHDFFSPTPIRRAYHHRPGIEVRKMDYRNLFAWHPEYVCVSHKVRHHDALEYTDEPGQWVATSVLRRRPGLEPLVD